MVPQNAIKTFITKMVDLNTSHKDMGWYGEVFCSGDNICSHVHQCVQMYMVNNITLNFSTGKQL